MTGEEGGQTNIFRGIFIETHLVSDNSQHEKGAHEGTLVGGLARNERLDVFACRPGRYLRTGGRYDDLPSPSSAASTAVRAGTTEGGAPAFRLQTQVIYVPISVIRLVPLTPESASTTAAPAAEIARPIMGEGDDWQTWDLTGLTFGAPVGGGGRQWAMSPTSLVDGSSTVTGNYTPHSPQYTPPPEVRTWQLYTEGSSSRNKEEI